MKRLYRTLRFQLLFRSLAILALLLCFIGGTQYMFMTRTMYENQAISIQSDINSMDQSVWRSIKTLARSETPAHPNLIYPGVTVAFINQSYKMSVLSEDPHAGPLLLSRKSVPGCADRYNGASLSGGSQ